MFTLWALGTYCGNCAKLQLTPRRRRAEDRSRPGRMRWFVMVSRRKTAGAMALIATGLVLSQVCLAADSRSVPRRKPAAGKRSMHSVHKTSMKAGAKTKRARKVTRFGANSRRMSHKRRLAQIHLQPERVKEIQQALFGSGYLKEEPNGAWDDQTRAAMRRYQSENGFPPTGLPEAKSLMKLGLGPHPLPEDVTANAASTARIQPNMGAGSSVPLPSASDPVKAPPAAQP